MAKRDPKYAGTHYAERRKLAPMVAAGLAVCWRCSKPIAPDEPWDLGHVPLGGPNDYAGPECRRCNRGTAGRVDGIAATAKPGKNPMHAELEAEPWADAARAEGATVWSRAW